VDGRLIQDSKAVVMADSRCGGGLLTTYLEMRRDAFRPAYVDAADVVIEKMQTADVDFYRFLYREVGEAWRWRDRLLLSDVELEAILSSPQTEVWTLFEAGAVAGYVELHRVGDATEIAYFGLRAAFMGRGLGKHLLSFGVQRAWNAGAARVWVHTCNLDGPHALGNYRARGFRVFKLCWEPLPERYR
jgi:GNAT superfamily N-acetyltransferase